MGQSIAYLVVSGVLYCNPFEKLELWQHDWSSQGQGTSLVPRGVAKFDVYVAGDELLGLDVARD